MSSPFQNTVADDVPQQYVSLPFYTINGDNLLFIDPTKWQVIVDDSRQIILRSKA